jgi:hypothetical protein
MVGEVGDSGQSYEREKISNASAKGNTIHVSNIYL